MVGVIRNRAKQLLQLHLDVFGRLPKWNNEL